jgi:hypothetical protein
MPVWLDITLVLLAIALAGGYLIARKVRSVKRIARDWTTGRVEACDSCPVIEIRKVQGKKG